MSTASTTNRDPAGVAQTVLDVVSVETEEVEFTIGPRRITGLVTNTTELENEARAARVYGKKGDARGR